MKSVYEHIHPKKFFRDHVLQGVRPDGRKLLAYRQIALNVDIIKRAEGSSTLKIGNSVFVCGINAELSSQPVENRLIVTMSCPIAQASDSEVSSFGDKLVLCSNLLTQVFRDADIIDYDSMKIVDDRMFWVLYCDVLCMNYDGALFDGAMIAIISALKTLELPTVEFDSNNESYSINKEGMNPIKIHDYPVSTTYGIFDNSIILVDPSYKEEQLCSFSVLTVIVLGDKLCLLHKHGSSKVPAAIIAPCISQAKKRIPLVHKLIDTVFMAKIT